MLVKIRIQLLAAMLLALFPGIGVTQNAKPAPKLTFSYQVQSSVAESTVKKADKVILDSVFLVVQVQLPEGWHINSETPPHAFLVPMNLKVEANGVQFGKPRFPKPEMVFSPAMGDTLPLYSGTFNVRISSLFPSGISSGAWPPTRVTLTYQSCNDTMCLPPKSVTVEY